MKSFKYIVSFVGIIFLLTACQGKVETKETKTDSAYPMTISNFARGEGSQEWTKKDETYPEVPKKVLANTQPAAELLLHLGLKEHIAGVGAVFGAGDPAVAKDFAELNHLSSGYIGKEKALSVSPDLVYGRGGLFDNQEWGNGTVDSINEMGIPTYVLETSVTGSTFASVYKDIENLGKLFNVPDKAKTFANEIKEQETAVKEKVKGVKQDRTFAYLHMSDPSEIMVYSAHGESFFNDLFKMAKLDNVFKDQTGDVSLETLIATNPDVLIVPDWSTYENGVSGKAITEALLKNPKLAGMKAIKNKQIFAVDYNYLFGYGYQSLTGIQQLVTDMYPDK